MIGGSSSLMPFESVSFSPVASSNRAERAILDLAPDQQHVELAQSVARVVAFQIVLGAKQALAAGLALAARDRAQRVETAGDGGEEALLRLHVGRDRPEQRGLRLVGAVRPAEPLNRRVGLPAGLQQIVDAQSAVLAPTVRRDSCARFRPPPRRRGYVSRRP